MKIYNVIEIYDNGEFVTITTETGTLIHLPSRETHSIVASVVDNSKNNRTIVLFITFNQ